MHGPVTAWLPADYVMFIWQFLHEGKDAGEHHQKHQCRCTKQAAAAGKPGATCRPVWLTPASLLPDSNGNHPKKMRARFHLA
jgi:hypothetical protein